MEARSSGLGESRAQGDENSALKNTEPDRRTTRRTSESMSMEFSPPQSEVCKRPRTLTQALQSLNQAVKPIWRLEQEEWSSEHGRVTPTQRNSLSDARHRRSKHGINET